MSSPGIVQTSLLGGSRPLGQSVYNQALNNLFGILANLEGLALVLYFFRDACAGALRYYLSILHLDTLWFIPDLTALACIIIFIYRYAIMGKNLIAVLTVLYMGLSLYIGYLFLEQAAGAASALKMIAPIFVGFCFCSRDLNEYKRLLLVVQGLFYLSVFGVILSSFVQLPWVGFSYEAIGGVKRSAATLWWSANEQRLAGFAADNTMAGFFILITFVLTSVRRGLLWVFIWGPIGFYALRLTTSKTNHAVFAIYIICLVVVRLLPEHYRFKFVHRLACFSFLTILIPISLIVVFSGIDLTQLSPSLYSMWDRINNSWQLPFVYLTELMPFGFVSGCGLGCFNYPQELFSNKVSYYVPVDNFYIGTYLMFGPIFVVFMALVIRTICTTKDIYKLTVVFVMNLFTVTVLSYGPASGLLMIGFSFSNVF